jgi:hypothetical protein
MRKTALLLATMTALILGGCATPYREANAILGFGAEVQRLEPEIWRVRFLGNGDTTYESVQTYWLYRSAELTLEQGFQGFQILTPIRLVGGDAQEDEPIQLASSGMIFIPMSTGRRVEFPRIEADIRLLKGPVQAVPGRVFDAARLKAALEPHVHGQKCDDGNVCPHVHRYLYPEGALP